MTLGFAYSFCDGVVVAVDQRLMNPDNTYTDGITKLHALQHQNGCWFATGYPSFIDMSTNSVLFSAETIAQTFFRGHVDADLETAFQPLGQQLITDAAVELRSSSDTGEHALSVHCVLPEAR